MKTQESRSRRYAFRPDDRPLKRARTRPAKIQSTSSKRGNMAGESGVKVGDLVWANDGGNDFIGTVLKPEHDTGSGELKALIQKVPGEAGVVAGYREPEDHSDKGDTFWLI